MLLEEQCRATRYRADESIVFAVDAAAVVRLPQ
jgi:hypothetical protein